MLKKRLFQLLLLINSLELSYAVPAFAHFPGNYSKLNNGITVRLKQPVQNGACLVKLQAVTDKIIHVTATPPTKGKPVFY
jgi:alpha-D-xyloside xylohydrolase